MTHKLGSLQNDVNIEYRYCNLFKHEVYSEWSRVVIAPIEKQISLMQEIAEKWDGPYGILYVLVLSRLGKRRPARYQSPNPCSWKEIELFTNTFREFFERDSRHHLWIIDLSSKNQVIYDNHNIIYSYGEDDGVISFLKEKGFREGNPTIPCPHVHSYNMQYDEFEDKVMNYYDWKEFPLQEEHDDP